MKIRVKPSRRRTDRITLNMASMIDCTFLLLAYFLFTTVLMKPEDRLSPTLQTQTREVTQASDFQPQKVEVLMLEGAATYRLATRTMRDRQQLLAALQPLPKEAGVFVQVYDGVPVSFAVAAIQIARDAGFDQVTYVPSK